MDKTYDPHAIERDLYLTWERGGAFEPSGEGVRVTWGLTGATSGPFGGYFAKMMDGWVGADYEDGLTRLKEVVEALPAAD